MLVYHVTFVLNHCTSVSWMGQVLVRCGSTAGQVRVNHRQGFCQVFKFFVYDESILAVRLFRDLAKLFFDDVATGFHMCLNLGPYFSMRGSVVGQLWVSHGSDMC